MDGSEIASAAEPYASALWEESMRTSLLMFAFLGCTLIFSYVFLRDFKVRSPFRWIVALVVFAGFVLVQAGGLRKPEVSVLTGTIEKIEQEETSLQWRVTVTNPREFLLQEGRPPEERQRDQAIIVPCIGSLTHQLQSGSEETLILLRNQAVGLRREGRTKIFLPGKEADQK